MDIQPLKYQKAFTLIELMIVIAIIGILATIAIPAYQDHMAKAQVSEAIILIDGLKSAVTEDFSQTGQCPNNVTGTNKSLAPATSITGKYVLKVETGGIASPITGDCTITAIMKSSGVNAAIQGAKIKLTMSTFNSSSIGWLCMANVEQKYVPLVCGYSSF